MKKRINGWQLAVAVAVISAFLWGCGGGDTVYLRNPDTLGRLETTGVNTQRVTLFQNPDGSLKGIDIGSVQVYPKDITLFFDSYRMGKVKSVLAADNSATFNLPNNDSGTYYAEFKNGKIYRLLLEKFQNITYQPMEYHVSSAGYFQYGKRASTSMDLSLDEGGTTVTLRANFGCDMLFGLNPNISYQDDLRAAFIEYTDGVAGNAHYAKLLKNVDGNIYAILSGIPLDAPGKMYIIGPEGNASQFNFNYRNSDEEYVWSASSSGSSEPPYLWSSYDQETDTLQLYQYIPAPEPPRVSQG